MLSCEYCGHKGLYLDMFRRNGRIFCSPKHAFAWTGHRHTPSQEAERLFVALADIAVVHIASHLRLATVNERLTPPILPTRSLDTQEYEALLVQFERNQLYMSEESAELLRALIEARLETYTEANKSMSVVGPLSADERLQYSTKILIRGPADYFLIKISGTPTLLLIVTLDKSTPIIVVKI